MSIWTTWGILLMILGFILVGIEMVLPGFSFPGVIGSICLVVSIFLNANTFMEGVYLTIGIIVVLGIMLAIVLRLLSRGKAAKGIILTDEQNKEKGYISATNLNYLLNKEGIALTDLRPSGLAEFNSEQYDVITKGNYILKGTPIIVYKIQGSKLIVKEAKKKSVS